MTSWACDSNCFNPNGFEIEMQVAEGSVNTFCTPAHQCEHGFGDCDSNADCQSGTTCQQNVGTLFGYIDPAIDVCVD